MIRITSVAEDTEGFCKMFLRKHTDMGEMLIDYVGRIDISRGSASCYLSRFCRIKISF